MKIFTLPIDPALQPASQPFRYPSHNDDYGVEQDFFTYLQSNPHLQTHDPNEANWHYLPVFWTRWHLNHDYGKSGIGYLQEQVRESMIDQKKTFTICQYDDGPVVEVGEARVFLASRKTERGVDIPLISSPHKAPLFRTRKKYLAGFIGRTATHPVRKSLHASLSDTSQIMFIDGDIGTKAYVKNLLSLYVVLAPRGYGGSSFRFYEAMQLGVVPFLISDLDTRPFKKWIDWDQISFCTNDSMEVENIIKSKIKNELLQMGNLAKNMYDTKLRYGKWCDFVIKELVDGKK